MTHPAVATASNVACIVSTAAPALCSMLAYSHAAHSSILCSVLSHRVKIRPRRSSFKNPQLLLTSLICSAGLLCAAHCAPQLILAQLFTVAGRLPDLQTPGDSLQVCAAVALVHFMTHPAVALCTCMQNCMLPSGFLDACWLW